MTAPTKARRKVNRRSALTLTGLVAATVAAATVSTGIIPAVDEAIAEDSAEAIPPIRSEVTVAGIKVQIAGDSLTLPGQSPRTGLTSRSGRRSPLPPEHAELDPGSLATPDNSADEQRATMRPRVTESLAPVESLNPELAPGVNSEDGAATPATASAEQPVGAGDEIPADAGAGDDEATNAEDSSPAEPTTNAAGSTAAAVPSEPGDPGSEIPTGPAPAAAGNSAAPDDSAADVGSARAADGSAEATERDDLDKAIAAIEVLADAGTVLHSEAIATDVANEVIIDRAETLSELVQKALDPEEDVDPDALYDAIADLTEVTESAELAPVVVEPAPMTAVDYLTYSRAEAQADRFRLRRYENSVAGYANGRIPAASMTSLSWAPGHRLRADAAAQLERLNIAFRAHFGRNLSVTDSYRSFENQVRVRALRPHLAAVPGTSNHGWGIAVDLSGGINRFGTAEHQWMRRNAPYFGWILPSWAQERGSRPEAWHWEFHPNQMVVVDGGGLEAPSEHANELLGNVGD